MGGLGHPNSSGRVAALAGVLCLAMLRSRDLAPRSRGSYWLLGLIIGLAFATSIACYSRTSMLAAGAAAFFLFVDRIWSRNGIALIALGFSLLVAGIVGLELSTGSDVLAEKVLLSTTKTGDIEELTTATGRNLIWAEAIRKIAERPLTGWGLNSAPLVLIDFSQHTHNTVLHAALSGGLIAGVLVVLLLSWNLVFGLRSGEPIIRAISVFVLISSLFEDTIIDTFPFPTTTLWIFALLYPSLYAVSESKQISDQSSQPTF
jgi:exopolysaccharide production protein ExoQ